MDLDHSSSLLIEESKEVEADSISRTGRKKASVISKRVGAQS